MEYIGIPLLLILIVKIKAISSAIKWLPENGEYHATEIRGILSKTTDVPQSAFFASFAKHNGGFRPFGVKDYKLRAFIQTLLQPYRFYRPSFPSAHPVLRLLLKATLWPLLLGPQIVIFSLRWSLGILLTFFRLTLFQYVFLSFLLSIYMVAAGLSYKYPDAIPFSLTEWNRTVSFSMAIGSLVMNLAMAVEFVFGHLFLSNYAVFFHMLSPRKVLLAGGSDIVLGLQILIMLIIVVFISGFASVLSVQLSHDGFSGDALENPEGITLTNISSIAVRCAYYTLTTLTTTGYGDIAPSNVYGIAIGMGLQIEAFAIIVFLLSVFWSTRPSANPPPNAAESSVAPGAAHAAKAK